jgi:hypothetical protein
LYSHFTVQEIVEEIFSNEVNAVRNSQQDLATEAAAERNEEGRCTHNGIEGFIWDDAFHLVPESFSFPSVNCKNMWLRWHLGQESHGIGPFKKLHEGRAY